MTKILKAFGSIVALAGLMTVLPGSAMADGASATMKAAQHAGFAMDAGDIDGMHRHLHHTLNCLVGSDGEGFDQSAGNPCQQDGGAIPQTVAGEMHTMLMEVAGQVRDAIDNNDMGAVKEAAMHVQEMLEHDE